MPICREYRRPPPLASGVIRVPIRDNCGSTEDGAGISPMAVLQNRCAVESKRTRPGVLIVRANRFERNPTA